VAGRLAQKPVFQPAAAFDLGLDGPFGAQREEGGAVRVEGGAVAGQRLEDADAGGLLDVVAFVPGQEVAAPERADDRFELYEYSSLSLEVANRQASDTPPGRTRRSAS
jgi:hypothetical protein